MESEEARLAALRGLREPGCCWRTPPQSAAATAAAAQRREPQLVDVHGLGRRDRAPAVREQHDRRVRAGIRHDEGQGLPGPATVVTASFSVVAGPPEPPSNLSRKFVPTAGEYTRIVTVLSVAVSTTEPPRPVMVVPK